MRVFHAYIALDFGCDVMFSPFETTCHTFENMILCLSAIPVLVSSHTQPFKQRSNTLENGKRAEIGKPFKLFRKRISVEDQLASPSCISVPIPTIF